MPSLLDIRRRVRAVKSTQQITKAMKMVAASRLRRAQLLASLSEQKQIDDQIKADLTQTLKEYGESFAAGRKTAA